LTLAIESLKDVVVDDQYGGSSNSMVTSHGEEGRTLHIGTEYIGTSPEIVLVTEWSIVEVPIE